MNLEVSIFIQLFIAAFLGALIGIERALAGKTAGLRTFALISMSSALFIIASKMMNSQFVGITNFDPSRVASQIIVAVGFLGAGVIIFNGSRVSGLTTAAGMWAAAGIGMAIGFQLYLLAIYATILTIFIFTILWLVEKEIKKEPISKQE